MTEILIFSIVEKFVGVAKIWYALVQGWHCHPMATDLSLSSLAEAMKPILDNNSIEEQRNGADHKIIINQQYADDISWITNMEVLK